MTTPREETLEERIRRRREEWLRSQEPKPPLGVASPPTEPVTPGAVAPTAPGVTPNRRYSDYLARQGGPTETIAGETFRRPFDPLSQGRPQINKKLVSAYNWFNRNVEEPSAAIGTATLPLVDPLSAQLLGIKPNVLHPGTLQELGKQYPWQPGWREAYYENVPLEGRVAGGIIFDPLNVVPGVGFTKVSQARRLGGIVGRAGLRRGVGEFDLLLREVDGRILRLSMPETAEAKAWLADLETQGTAVRLSKGFSPAEREAASQKLRNEAVARATEVEELRPAATQAEPLAEAEGRLLDEGTGTLQPSTPLEQAQQDLFEAEGRLELALAPSRIVRPPKNWKGWGILSDDQLEEIARQSGFDPTEPDWWFQVDPVVIKEVRQGGSRVNRRANYAKAWRELGEAQENVRRLEQEAAAVPILKEEALPLEQRGAIQAGMGIGERPAQGTLGLGTQEGISRPLIDPAQVAERQRLAAEAQAGQAALPEVVPADVPGVTTAQVRDPVPPTVPASGIPPSGRPPGGQLPPPGGIPPGGAPGEPAGFAANIRLSKYPEDIRSTIKEWADAHPEAVQVARRGVRSDARVLADAQELVEDMGGNFTKLQRKWKPGDAWNAEEITAIRGTLRAKTEKVLAAATVARAQNSSANHVNLLVAMAEHARIQEVVHGVSAEAGRALRAFRQEAFDATKATDIQRLQRLLQQIGKPGQMEDVAAALGKLDLENPVAVNNFIRNTQKPSLWDYITELYVNSILSGPKTHIINELSNLVNMAVSPVERFAAAGVERGLAPLQRRSVERFFSEVPADVFGSMQGIREGVRAGLTTMRDGITPAQASKWDFRRTAFKGKLGRIIRGPGTALEAADAMNYAMNYRAALGAGIIRQVRREGLRGRAAVERIAELTANPAEALSGTRNLMKEAAETAEYRLFRQPPGKITAGILHLRETFPPLKFVIPFISTPMNLLKFGVERSPVGVFNPSLWRNLAIKNPAASDQIARVFLGSSLAALIAWKFQEGRITGAAPRNQKARDKFYEEGKQPFAVRIGGYWIQYQRLEPFNQPIAQVAAALDAIEAKDKSASEKVGEAAITISTNLVSQSYLSSLGSLLDATSDFGRSGEAFLTRIASGMVPASAALRTVAQQVDPTIRKPTTIPERLETGIPELSKKVPPRLGSNKLPARRTYPAWSPIVVSKDRPKVPVRR